MRQFITIIMALVTLTTTLLPEGGALITITTDRPQHLVVQLDPEGGAVLTSDTIAELDLLPGDTFARTIAAHGPGGVRVRVWASSGAELPAVDQVIALPTLRQYVALVAH